MGLIKLVFNDVNEWERYILYIGLPDEMYWYTVAGQEVKVVFVRKMEGYNYLIMLSGRDTLMDEVRKWLSSWPDNKLFQVNHFNYYQDGIK